MKGDNGRQVAWTGGVMPPLCLRSVSTLSQLNLHSIPSLADWPFGQGPIPPVSQRSHFSDKPRALTETSTSASTF